MAQHNYKYQELGDDDKKKNTRENIEVLKHCPIKRKKR